MSSCIESDDPVWDQSEVDFGSAQIAWAYRQALAANVVRMPLHAHGAEITGATPWHELGTDEARAAFLHEIEQTFHVDFNDDDRDGFQTVDDLLALMNQRLVLI